MGSNMGIRIKVKIKDEYLDRFKLISDFGESFNWQTKKYELDCFWNEMDYVGDFDTPYDFACSAWEKIEKFENGIYTATISSYKNDITMEQFAQDLFKYIDLNFEPYIEMRHEYWDSSMLYKYADGVLTKYKSALIEDYDSMYEDYYCNKPIDMTKYEIIYKSL